MKKAFPKLRLGEVCTLSNGYPFKPSDWNGTGVPIIRIQNLNDPTKPFNRTTAKVPTRCSIDTGDVLLSWSGTPGTSFGCFMWSRGPALLNQHIFRVTVDPVRMDKEFFIYAVNAQLEEMIGQAHGGVGLRHITKGKLEAIELGAPDLTEQRRIVGRIKEMLARVDEIDACKASVRLASENLLRASRRGLLTPSASDDNGWINARLDSVSDVIYGISAAIAKNKDPDLGPPIIRMANMSLEGDLDLSDLRYMPIPKGRESHFLLKKGDLLLNWRSGSAHHVGKTALFMEDGDFTCASFILRIRAQSDRANNRFLRHVLNFMRAEGVFEAQTRMQVNSKLNASQFAAFLIHIPKSVEAQERLADDLDQIEARVRAMRMSFADDSAAYNAIRDAILRKAFAGEL